LEQIARSERGPDDLRFKVFDWGSVGGVSVGERFYTLVYDESDEIALPSDERTTAWKQRVGPGTGSQLYSILQPKDEHHSTNVKLVEGHFYLVTEVYYLADATGIGQRGRCHENTQVASRPRQTGDVMPILSRLLAPSASSVGRRPRHSSQPPSA
jgi:hypothetical protein